MPSRHKIAKKAKTDTATTVSEIFTIFELFSVCDCLEAEETEDATHFAPLLEFSDLLSKNHILPIPFTKILE